CQQSNGDPRTF
nr:immunoglobulin light chain junction region [Mus musculus]NSM01601.1 immunoglobulin light chain junction region [Mus musculus]NSM01817.1 immunoglobulin light chain junction region [Mus musculus]